MSLERLFCYRQENFDPLTKYRRRNAEETQHNLF